MDRPDRPDRPDAAARLRMRPATAHDARQLASLHVEAWQELMADHHRAAPPGEARADWLETHWRADLQTSASRAGATLLLDEGEPVGFCAWRPAAEPDSAAEIVGLYLQRRYRGHGAGRDLLDRSTVAMRVMGFSAAIVWVWASATEYRRFFERLGFHADAERHGNELGQPLYQHRLQRALLEGIEY